RPSAQPYALLTARTIRSILNTTWAVSETGASGPTGNRYGDAAGHACIAVAGPVERGITLATVRPICGRLPKPHWICSKHVSRRTAESDGVAAFTHTLASTSRYCSAGTA